MWGFYSSLEGEVGSKKETKMVLMSHHRCHCVNSTVCCYCGPAAGWHTKQQQQHCVAACSRTVVPAARAQYFCAATAVAATAAAPQAAALILLLLLPLLGAALENFPARKQKKSFGSTYARKIEAKKTSRRTIRATPKIGDFHFRRWWPIST